MNFSSEIFFDFKSSYNFQLGAKDLYSCFTKSLLEEYKEMDINPLFFSSSICL